MNRSVSRMRRITLAIIGAVVLTSAASATLAASGGMLFTGGGFGASREAAIQAAIWDAEASAASEGLFTCQLVGEPEVFPQSNRPKRAPAFTAEATLSCTA